jgi:hypothetical protein
LYYFDRRTIDDWKQLMTDQLQEPCGSTAMATARYTVDVMWHVTALRSATIRLAALGHPVSRAPLADASLELMSCVENLREARTALLKIAEAERATDAD